MSYLLSFFNETEVFANELETRKMWYGAQRIGNWPVIRTEKGEEVPLDVVEEQGCLPQGVATALREMWRRNPALRDYAGTNRLSGDIPYQIIEDVIDVMIQRRFLPLDKVDKASARGGKEMSNTTIRTLVLEYIDNNGASHIREMHVEILQRRPNTPEHTIRARLSEAVSDGILNRLDKGFYDLYAEDKDMTSVVSYPVRCNQWGRSSYNGNRRSLAVC